MSEDSSNTVGNPLARLVIVIGDLAAALLRFGLVREGDGPDDPSQPVSATDAIEQFRQPAKDIIVWLELRGRDADAAEVDDAMAELYGVTHAYDAGELHAEFSRYHDEPATPFDQLTQAISSAASRLEDLLDSIPDDVWQGFDDA